MKKPVKQKSRHVEAVLAALDLLDCFQAKPHLAIKELIAMTGHTRNRIMRLVGTLEHRGYLVFNPDRGIYGLGPRLMLLGRVFENSQGLVNLARPILRSMVMETGESVSLYARDRLERVVLAREEGTQNLRFQVTEGQRMELHAGAGGKILLAWAPESIRHQVLAGRDLPRRDREHHYQAPTSRQRAGSDKSPGVCGKQGGTGPGSRGPGGSRV